MRGRNVGERFTCQQGKIADLTTPSVLNPLPQLRREQDLLLTAAQGLGGAASASPCAYLP